MKERPDVFTHVHQGIRRALFDASTALARAQGEPEALASALELVDDALLFVHRHGQNEDALLVPLFEERAPQVAARMRDAHQVVESELDAVRALRARVAPELYLRLSVFIAHYLEHMAEEELDLEPEIRAVISDEELVAGGQRAVTRVDPGERLRMLQLMLPALPIAAARTMLQRMPEAVARELMRVDARFSSASRLSSEGECG